MRGFGFPGSPADYFAKARKIGDPRIVSADDLLN
jgi:hypothetical protein